MQYFELLGLPATFVLDQRALDANFRVLQTEHHPDKFAAASDVIRRAAEQKSALINDAYRTLKDPVLRAAYLIKNTCGADPFDERNTKMPADFLMQQIELREEMAEFCAAGIEEKLEALADQVDRQMAAIEQALAQVLDHRNDFDTAVVTVRKLRFLAKMRSELDDALAQIES